MAEGLSTINLGACQGYSGLEMAKSIKTASGQSVPYTIALRRVGDIAAC